MDESPAGKDVGNSKLSNPADRWKLAGENDREQMARKLVECIMQLF